MLFDYPWYFLIFCLLAGVIYAFAMYFIRRGPLETRLRWVLAIIRCLAVSFLALLLLGPIVKHTFHEKEKPLVVLAEDVSKSVSAKTLPGSEFHLRDLEESLGGDFRVIYRSNEDNIYQTDLGELLQAPPDAAAVVLSSDGLYNRGQNPALIAERLGIPVYTVAMGDTVPENDAWLSHLRVNRIAYRNSTMTVEVTVNAVGLEGAKTRLHVSGDDNKDKVAPQEITYSSAHFCSTYTLTIPIGDQTGLRRYELRLGEVVGREVSQKNNRLAFYVDVLDNRQRVAIVGNAPHPDLAALKHSVESNANYEAQVVMASDVMAGKHRDLGKCSMAILHNIPSAAMAVPEGLKDMPLMFVMGTQTDLPRFNAMRLGVEIVARTKKNNEWTAVHNDAFTLFHHDRSDAEAIELLPPLTAPFGEAKYGSGLQILYTARLGTIDTRQPLIAAMAQGGKRRAFVWGEGLWRWRMNDYLNNQSHVHFDRLISQLVNFVAQEEGRERFRVESEHIYPVGQNVILQAQLYNESYEPINIPEAKMTLQGDSVGGNYVFGRQGDGYALNLGSLPQGTYHYLATTQLGAEELSATGSFAVEESNLEDATLTANHTLLRTISATTGASMVYPDEMDWLEKELRTIKPVIYSHTRHRELLSMVLSLIIILLLLSGEWVLRKYNGEV